MQYRYGGLGVTVVPCGLYSLASHTLHKDVGNFASLSLRPPLLKATLADQEYSSSSQLIHGYTHTQQLSSLMSTETRYRAKYDFAASGKGMLTFKVGDRFILVSRTSDDWLTVKSMAGDMGLAPASYLEAVQVCDGVCVCLALLPGSSPCVFLHEGESGNKAILSN